MPSGSKSPSKTYQQQFLLEEKFPSMECSNPLENWEAWVEKRKKQYGRFQKLLGRKPGELVSNYGEDFRKIQEERALLDNAKVNTNFEKYRGNPAFWALPEKLKPLNSEDTRQYFAVQTRLEQNVIPPLEYVATPDAMLQEKGIHQLLRSIYTKWSSSKFRQQQLEAYSDKLKTIEPHIPDSSMLFIVGKNILEDSIKRSIDEEVQVPSHTFLHTGTSSCFELNKIRRLYVNVNKSQIFDPEVPLVKSPKIRYLFYYTDLKTPVRETLALQNMGQSTVKILWKKIKDYYMFRDETNRFSSQETCFYFGKHEILVRPGETEEIPLWFLPKKHGMYIEKWTVKTIPEILLEENELIIIFKTLTEDDKHDKAVRAATESIENGLRNTMIKDCLKTIVFDLKYTGRLKVCNVSKKQMFEFRNLNERKKPAFAYNRSILEELRAWYGEMEERDLHFDDLSIKDMKLLARKKDIIDYVKQQTELFETAENLRNELEKFGKIKNPVSSNVNKRTHLEKLNNIVNKFVTPMMIPNYNREKHVTAFTIFCSYFEKMCDSLDQSVQQSKKKPFCVQMKTFLSNSPDRWITERFDDVWIPKTTYMLPDPYSLSVLPKPAYLKEFDADDISGIYMAYLSKSTKGTTQTKVQLPDYLEHTEGRQSDPIIRTSVTSTDSCTSDSNKADWFDHYNRYIIVYNTLLNAVDAMVDAIETFKENLASDDVVLDVFKTGHNEYHKKLDLHLDALTEKESKKNYYNDLMDLVLLKNDKVIDYVLKEKILGKMTIIDDDPVGN